LYTRKLDGVQLAVVLVSCIAAAAAALEWGGRLTWSRVHKRTRGVRFKPPSVHVVPFPSNLSATLRWRAQHTPTQHPDSLRSSSVVCAEEASLFNAFADSDSVSFFALTRHTVL
jgi:hypothetical protein